MHRIMNSDPDLDSLRVELRKKEHDLLLAARFGKGLLEENDQLKNQLKLLRDEYSNQKEVSKDVVVGYYTNDSNEYVIIT